jgi:hypothetical protein
VLNYKKVALKQARNNIIQQQRLSKIRYDRNRPHPVYQVGDLVWIKVLTGRSKLDARYTGPVRIIQVLTPVSFIVQNDADHQFQVHSSSIKPVYQNI